MDEKQIRNRLHQIFRWLNENYPGPGKKPRLKVVNKMPNYLLGNDGAYVVDNRIIYIQKGHPRSPSIWCLVHEYAHFLVDPNGKMLDTADEGHYIAWRMTEHLIEERLRLNGYRESEDIKLK